MPDALEFEVSRFRQAHQVLQPEQQKQAIPDKHSRNQPGRPRCRNNPHEADQQSAKKPRAKTDPEPPRRMRARAGDGGYECRTRIHLGTSTAERISAMTESAVRPSGAG